jgi:hypothetical protein
MLKSFNLFTEAQHKIYGKSNNFSEGHRYPNLPIECIMYDIDNLLLSTRNIIRGIIEDKYKYDSDSLGSPFVKGNLQRKLFYNICKSIDLVLLLFETSTRRIYKVQDKNSVKIDYDLVINYGKILKTDNLIYIEFRKNKPIALMYRTNGVKETDLYSIDTYQAVEQLSQRLLIPIYLVDDITSTNIIYIKKLNDSKTHEIEYNYVDSWYNVYKELGLY